MTITGIEPLTKSRYKIYIDNEFAFVLYKGELRMYHIEEGYEISKEVYGEITEKVLVKRVRLRVMELLKKRDFTVSQLRSKLKDGLYSEILINNALDYVASFHYTDDSRYALAYINDNIEIKTKKRIIFDLKNKGVSEEVISKAFESFYDDGGVQDEEAMIKKLLVTRRFYPEKADFKEKQKQAAFLYGKGFSMESIMKCIDGEFE